MFLLLSHECLYAFKSILGTEIYKNTLVIAFIHWESQVFNRARQNLHWCKHFHQIGVCYGHWWQNFQKVSTFMFFFNTAIAVNWSKLTHKMTNNFMSSSFTSNASCRSSTFYLVFIHNFFYFFKYFLWTSLLQCWTSLYRRVALHCTTLECDRWYVDM